MPDAKHLQPPAPIVDLNACLSPASFWTPHHIVSSAWLQHAPFGFWLMDALRPRSFVELGTHSGFSYLVFCQAVRRLHLSTRCHAIDTWEGDAQCGHYTSAVQTRLAEIHDPLYADFSRLVRATFETAVSWFADGTIDLLHIDGRHDYQSVRSDFELWRSKLSDRGVILFHDTRVRRSDFGVWRLWHEIRGEHPHFEFSHGHGLGVLGVGSHLPAAMTHLFALGQSQDETVREIYHRLGSAIEDQSIARPDKTGAAFSVRPTIVQSSPPAFGNLHLHMAILAPKFLDVRTHLPMRELAKAPGISSSVSTHDIELPRLPVEQPKILFIQRIGFQTTAYWRELLPQVLSRGWLVVSEFDDHPELIAAVHGMRVDAQAWNAARFTHAVQTSTPSLREAFRAFNPEVEAFENAAFDPLPDVAERPADGPLKVFFGALNRGGISPRIGRRLNELVRPGLDYVVVHDRAFFDALGDVPKQFHDELPYNRYLDVMGTCNVALMPIEGEPGEMYKSDLKFIEASSCGLASIASPLVYGQTVRDFENGLIATTVEDWASALARLHDDPALRSRLARAARAYVADHRMFAMQIEARLAWYRGLWTRRHSLNESMVRRLNG